MLIHLYERVVEKDGSSIIGRLVGEVRCKGDGTPGEIILFEDVCNERWDVRDVTHEGYTIHYLICDQYSKSRLNSLFNEAIYITTDGGWLDKEGTMHYTGGKFLEPWYRETIEYVITYKLPASICGNLVGKIVED